MAVSALSADAGSGVALVEVSLDGDPYATYSTTMSLAEGTHTIQFRATDTAGNVTESPLQSISVDTIPPSIELAASWDLGQSVPFYLEDNGSGLAHLRKVILDDDERYPKVASQFGISGQKYKGEIDWNGRFKGGILAPPGGEYYAKLKVEDNAGNESIQFGQIIVPFATSDDDESEPDSSPIILVPVATEAPLEPPLSPLPEPSTEEQAESLQPLVASEEPSSQAETVVFSSGPASTSQFPDFQSPVLWGASATAAIGAFAAEIAARRRQEEAARRKSRSPYAGVNQRRKQLRAAYAASVRNFKAKLNQAQAMGMSKLRVEKMRATFSSTGKIGGLFATAQNYVTTAIDRNAANKAAARRRA